MAIVQCAFGHYYDDEKERFCPMCRQTGAVGEVVHHDLQSQVTVSGFSLGTPSGGATQLLDGTEFQPEDFKDVVQSYDVMQDKDATIGLFALAGVGDYTAGWLVCTSGENKGASFTVRIGRNFCGSGVANDIVLPEADVAEVDHFSVIYDPKKNSFYLVPGNGAVFHNGEFVAEPFLLKPDDEIEIGSAHLVFVPFCNGERSWG